MISLSRALSVSTDGEVSIPSSCPCHVPVHASLSLSLSLIGDLHLLEYSRPGEDRIGEEQGRQDTGGGLCNMLQTKVQVALGRSMIRAKICS